jgi:hypothetical protein
VGPRLVTYPYGFIRISLISQKVYFLLQKFEKMPLIVIIRTIDKGILSLELNESMTEGSEG